MEWTLLPKTLGGVLATLTTLVLGLLMWRVQAHKGQVDESATVLKAWKEMVDAHQIQLTNMREEFASYKKGALEEFASYKKSSLEEITSLRDRLGKAEARIRDLEEENAGLKRAIAQNSQSAVWALDRHKPTPSES